MSTGAPAYNQDFVTNQGDDVFPIFTVRTSDLSTGTVVDISTVSEISWSARRNLDTAAAVTKTKTGGGVAFVTNGIDGQFQVTITAANTALLDGWYIHQATITDAFGSVQTVTLGRMQVGLSPTWTNDPGSVATEQVYQVRALIGDTIQSDQQLADSLISWSLTNYSNVYLAAAECARMIKAQYARKVDTVQGELRTMYGQQTRNYAAVAAELEQRGLQRGGGLPYGGGISVSDKQTVEQDTDRVPPMFNVYWEDNRLPISPVGQTTSSPAGSEGSEGFPT